jgi:hypothetical protein
MKGITLGQANNPLLKRIALSAWPGIIYQASPLGKKNVGISSLSIGYPAGEIQTEGREVFLLFIDRIISPTVFSLITVYLAETMTRLIDFNVVAVNISIPL